MIQANRELGLLNIKNNNTLLLFIIKIESAQQLHLQPLKCFKTLLKPKRAFGKALFG
jgi:hypothetical protein